MSKQTIITRSMGQGITVLVFLTSLCFSQSTSVDSTDWKAKDGILKRMLPPAFPDKDFNIVDFGAVNNGKVDCSHAIMEAIDACSRAGGGRVVIPAGKYLSGPIRLKNNVNLYVSRDAAILFLTESSKYIPVVFTRWEGVECMNYSALIYAYKVKNVAVTGEGVLDGQGSNDSWWPWKGNQVFGAKAGVPTQENARKRLFKMGEDNEPVEKRIFGEGSYLRPNFFQTYLCENVYVQGVTFKNSPMWFLNPVLSKNVWIINVKTVGLGPNNDGCDPESCSDVLIRDCYFDNGDDCIAVKSGRNADGRRVNIPCENLVIEGCRMRNGHAGISLGSEVSGGIRNIFIENDTMDSPNLDRALRIKTNAMRGGIIENIFMKNVKIGQVSEAAIKIDYFYEEGEKGNFIPVVRNIVIKNVECEKSTFAIWVKAFSYSPATNISLENCSFKMVKEPNVLENVKNLSMINLKFNFEK